MLPGLPRPRWPWRERAGREPAARPAAAGSVRVLGACYAAMAVVTVVATAVGFWLSYVGLHAFAQRAGLRGPEAWAWPSSVDLFILTGELGITISTLRDGAHDWRASVYFAAGCGPSVTFNVLHVFVALPRWGTYAVAATPPIAALLALAALMQQVLGLPEALRQWHDRQQQAEPGTLSPHVPSAAETAALASLRATVAAGNPLSQNQLIERFRLTRAEAAKVRELAAAGTSDNGTKSGGGTNATST
jgi:hypothetical protein